MAARVLFAIMCAEADALTAAQIGERLGISPAAVSGAVRYLIQIQRDYFEFIHAEMPLLLARWQAARTLILRCSTTFGAGGLYWGEPPKVEVYRVESVRNWGTRRDNQTRHRIGS